MTPRRGAPNRGKSGRQVVLRTYVGRFTTTLRRPDVDVLPIATARCDLITTNWMFVAFARQRPGRRLRRHP